MSSILCRHELVEHPYCVDALGIHIHSSQELRYMIYNYPIFVMDDFADELLTEFICKELDMDYLVGRMGKLTETGNRSEDTFMLLLSECDCYSDKEIQEFKQTVVIPRALRPAEYKEGKANYIFQTRRYDKVAQRYTKILEYPKDKKVDNLLLVRVYNNLGAPYAMMLQFRRAPTSYGRTYDLGKDLDVLERVCFLSIFSPKLDMKKHYQSIFTEELRGRWEKETDMTSLDTGQGEEARTLRILSKGGPIRRINGVAQMVQRWRQGYKMTVQVPDDTGLTGSYQINGGKRT